MLHIFSLIDRNLSVFFRSRLGRSQEGFGADRAQIWWPRYFLSLQLRSDSTLHSFFCPHGLVSFTADHPKNLYASSEMDHQHVCFVVNDRKFLARIIFFSHTKSVSSNNPRSDGPQPNRLRDPNEQSSGALGEMIRKFSWSRNDFSEYSSVYLQKSGSGPKRLDPPPRKQEPAIAVQRASRPHPDPLPTPVPSPSPSPSP